MLSVGAKLNGPVCILLSFAVVAENGAGQRAPNEGVREVGGQVDGLAVVLGGLHVLAQFVKRKSPNEVAWHELWVEAWGFIVVP